MLSDEGSRSNLLLIIHYILNRMCIIKADNRVRSIARRDVKKTLYVYKPSSEVRHPGRCERGCTWPTPRNGWRWQVRAWSSTFRSWSPWQRVRGQRAYPVGSSPESRAGNYSSSFYFVISLYEYWQNIHLRNKKHWKPLMQIKITII